jgi:hypothetical protein
MVPLSLLVPQFVCYLSCYSQFSITIIIFVIITASVALGFSEERLYATIAHNFPILGL